MRRGDGVSVSERRAVRLDQRRRERGVSAAPPHRLGRREDPRGRQGASWPTSASRSDYDKMPADLSGGMRKRAGLARAMALDPDILLVDEPSAGLDPITADEIDELLVELKKKGTTLVVVTHNIPSARHVGDELAMLHEGKVIARGTAAELDRATTSWCARSCGRKDRGRADDVIESGRRRRVRGHRRAAVHRRALHDRRAAHAVRGALHVYAEFAQARTARDRARSSAWPGMDAGEVTEIRIPDIAVGKVPRQDGGPEDLRQLIRTDSVATTQTEGLVGAIFVNIGAGTEAGADRARRRHDAGPRAVPDLRPAAAGERHGHAGQRHRGGAARRRREGGQADRADRRGCARADRGHPPGHHRDRPERQPHLGGHAARSSPASTTGKGTIGKLVNDDALYQQVAADCRRRRRT